MTKKSPIENRISVDIRELAVLTGLGASLLYREANDGSLPGCRRIGNRFVIHLETFLDWMKSGKGDEWEG